MDVYRILIPYGLFGPDDRDIVAATYFVYDDTFEVAHRGYGYRRLSRRELQYITEGGSYCDNASRDMVHVARFLLRWHKTEFMAPAIKHEKSFCDVAPTPSAMLRASRNKVVLLLA